MIDFPCLEVIGTFEGPRVPWALGTRLPLHETTLVGNSPDAALQLPTGAPGALHARFERKHGRWWIVDHGTAQGTRYNGNEVHDAQLEHGDVIEFPASIAFRVLFREPARQPMLEEAVFANPDDEERWFVWADWLLEHDEEAGARIRGVRTPQSDARCLGALAGAWRHGWLDVDWKYGFPSRVVVRAPSETRPFGENAARLVGQLTQSAVFRFLTHLEVDPQSFGSGAHSADEVTGTLRALLQGPPTWKLTSLRIGPLLSRALAPGQLELLERVVVGLGGSTTTLERVLFTVGHAWLEVLRIPSGCVAIPNVGRSVGLSDEEANFVGAVEGAAVFIEASPAHDASRAALNVTFRDGRWLVEDVAGVLHRGHLKVNGRPAVVAHLRDHDRIEVVEGLELRFRLRPSLE